MANSANPLICLNGGEWAPGMDARTDLPSYRKACRKLCNMICMKQGGVTRRPGTQFIAQGKGKGGGGASATGAINAGHEVIGATVNEGGFGYVAGQVQVVFAGGGGTGAAGTATVVNGAITAVTITDGGSGYGSSPSISFVQTAAAVSRMQEFEFAPGTTFMLEFCDYGIRFYSNGAQVQVSGLPAWASGTSYPDGAFVTYSGTTYYLFNGPLINSTTAPPSDAAHWVAQSAYEVPSPYSASNFDGTDYWGSDVFVLQCKPINDVVYIVHPNFPVWKLTSYSNTNWVMQQVQFLTPALLDQNATDSWLTAGATTGSGVSLAASANAWATDTFYAPGNSVLEGGSIYNCVSVHTSGTFSTDLANGLWLLITTFQAAHVGSYWQLAYNRAASSETINITGNGTSSSMAIIGAWEVQTYGTWNATIAVQASYDGGSTWQTITTLKSAADANFDISGQDVAGGLYQLVITGWVTETSATIPRVTITATNQFVYGLVEITAVASAYSATCTVITPLYSTDSTIYWSEGAWSAVRGYPQAIAVFQERVWYGASAYEPQRVWATQTDDIENFALVDQSQATYGLAFDLNAPGRGPIQWLNAQTDLFAGLAGAEWVLTSGQQNAAITPTAILALEHSVNGSAPSLPGEIIQNACFYVQRRGTTFQQMLFSVFTNKYMSQDLLVLSQHLTAAGIKQFDFQQQFENQSVLWAVCGDGSLISMNYAMDQEVFGWSKHLTGDAADFGFLSVQVIYGADGSDDEVWVSVLRAGQPFCSIERINPVDWQTFNLGCPQISSAVYSDCSVSITSPGSNIISGLPTFLAGKTGCAMIVPAGTNSAMAVNDLTISSGGTVTIPNYVPATGDVVTIGLPIPWAVMPMRLDLDPREGQTPGIKKAISKLYLRLLNSLGGNVANRQGQEAAIKWRPITQNSGNPPPFLANEPVDKEIDVAGIMQYDYDPEFTIGGTDPLPFTLLGVQVIYDIGGRT